MVVIFVVKITDNLEVLWQDDRGEELYNINNDVRKEEIINDIVCLNCRKTFKPKNNQQKYCCQECKYQYSRNHNFITVKCVNCGKDITKHRDNIKKNINNYYCDDCRKDYQHKQFYEYRKC